MLCEKFSAEFFRANLPDLTQWVPFPPVSDRESWEKLSQCELNRIRKTELIEEANSIVNQPWPELSATLFAEFIRNGNRTRYENPYFVRRNNLGVLVLAECFENQGRYLEEIMNGIWSILSEPSWTVPAHTRYLDNDILPDPDQVFVDLFAGTTAMTLSQTYSLLKNKLEAISPGLCKTLKQYLDQRIFTPVETQKVPHWWLEGKNNWTPWCAANVLGSALIMLADDRERLVALIMQLLTALDLYINNYDDDGGCDEGPMYWNVSPGELLIALELLNSATNDALIEIYDNVKIKNMGEYIHKVHMGGKWCFSPADARAILKTRPGIVYRYGEKINSNNMKQLAVNSFFVDEDSCDSVLYQYKNFNGDLLPFILRDIFWLPENPVYSPIKHPPVDIFPDLQIMIARESAETGTGFTIGCKAGSNHENHNHNDIGQFEVFCDGTPIVVDLGVGQYTRKTFSPQRYDIWYIGAQGHNAPQVNGILQQDGEFHAENVVYETTYTIAAMSLNLTKAYPPESQLEKLTRQVTLDRSIHQVTVSDGITFKRNGNTITLPLLFQAEPHLTSSGAIDVPVGDNKVSLKIETEGKLKTELQKVELDDEKHRAVWGDYIYKLLLTFETDSNMLDYTLSFSRK